MRRNAVISINIHDIDFDKKTIGVLEKGGLVHKYKISQEGLNAIKTYIDRERLTDNEQWNSPAFFLSNSPNKKGDGRLGLDHRFGHFFVSVFPASIIDLWFIHNPAC